MGGWADEADTRGGMARNGDVANDLVPGKLTTLT
jgi:hypothetical protein